MRTIVRERQFTEQLQKLIPGFQRADDFVAGVEWVLSRDPTRGFQARPNSPVWCVPTANEPDLPPAVISYCFNDTHVYLLSIRLVSRNGED
jgi:hypothetical protein